MLPGSGTKMTYEGSESTMLPQSYVGDAKLGVHPQCHIAENRLQRPLGSRQRAAGSGVGRGPQSDPPGGGRGQLLAKPKVPDNKTFGCFVECYLN